MSLSPSYGGRVAILRAAVMTRTHAVHLTKTSGPYYAGWQGLKTESIKITWRKLRAQACLPAWFAPRVLRHTVASELRRLGVPEWDVKGVLGHTGSGVTDGYAKFDGERVRDVLDAWMIDLSQDVPALRKLCPKPLPPRAGSALRKMKTAQPVKVAPYQPLKVVGGTGFEPVTPTMSR